MDKKLKNGGIAIIIGGGIASLIFIIIGILLQVYALAIVGVVILFVAIIVSFGMAAKYKQQKEDDLVKRWEMKGLKLEIAYRKNDFILFLDREKGKFAVDYSDNIYNISDIVGYGAFRYYNNAERKYKGHVVVINLKTDEIGPWKKLETGIDNKYGYYKDSYLYNLGEESINEYLGLLKDLTKNTREQFYKKHDYNPREEYWFNGQMFSYDLNAKKFCTFTYLGLTMYNFSNYLNFYIKKDETKLDVVNVRNALFGAIIGGGAGAAYWAKDSTTICSNLKLVIECDLGSNSQIDNTEFLLIDNQKVEENSQLYKGVTEFIDNVSRICNMIEKQH